MRGWLSYIAKARSVEKQIEAYKFLKDFLDNYCEIEVLEFDENAATTSQNLQRSRVRIGTMDLKIASIALANDAILLTRNLKDFLQVPDLKAEDWTI